MAKEPRLPAKAQKPKPAKKASPRPSLAPETAETERPALAGTAPSPPGLGEEWGETQTVPAVRVLKWGEEAAKSGGSARDRLLIWHKQLAFVSGSIALAAGRTGVKRSELADWARIAAQVGADMEAFLGERG